MFVWEKIVGFEVVGSIQDQKFTGDLLHERASCVSSASCFRRKTTKDQESGRRKRE